MRCYDNIWRAVNFLEIPTEANKQIYNVLYI